MRYPCIFFGVVCLSILVSCSPSSVPTEEELQRSSYDDSAIRVVRQEMYAAFEAGNIDRFTADMNGDVVIMPPNQPALEGVEAVRSHYENVFKTFTFKGTTRPSAGAQRDNWAYMRGRYVGTMTNKETGVVTEFDNKVIEIYQRFPDGSWKCQTVIWNSNKPIAEVST